MAIMSDNYSQYQVTAFATNKAMTYYSVSRVGTEEIEFLSLNEIRLLHAVKLPLFDADMNPIKFQGENLIGNIPDITDLVETEEEYDTDDLDDADDFFDEYDAYDETEEGEENEEDFYDDFYSEEPSDNESCDDDDDYADFFNSYENDESDEEEESTVSRLYGYLTEEQIKVLKRYYLWYSQRLFSDAQKDPTLGMKDKNRLAQKKANLSTLRNTGGLWHYAGFIDMGRFGVGHCTLGHPLRYMHLAWDVTASDIETAFFGEDYNNDFEEVIESNNCIVFGIKCIADFFEVDGECIRALQRAQRESLKDMALMCQYYENNMVDEVCSTFSSLDEFVSRIKVYDLRGVLMGSNFEPTVRLNLASFYLQFREIGMVPPKSLIQEIRDDIIGWKEHKFTGNLDFPRIDIFKRSILRFLNMKSCKVIDDFTIYDLRRARGSSLAVCFLNYMYVYLTYEICGWYKYNADTNKDEGGASKGVKALLNQYYRYNLSNVYKDVEYSYDRVLKMIDIVEFYSKYSSADESFVAYHPYRYNADSTELDKTNLHRTGSDEYLINFDEKIGSSLCDAVKLYRSQSDTGFVYRLNRDFKESLRRVLNTDDYDINLTFKQYSEIYSFVKNQFESHLENFINWSKEVAMDDIAKRIESKEEKQREHEALMNRIAEERRLQEEEEAIKKVEEDRKREELLASVADVKTPMDAVRALNDADLSSVSDKFTFNRKILKSVVDSGKEPSAKQFYYITKLYKEVFGVDFQGERAVSDRVSLSDRSDLKEALDWVVNHRDLIDSKTSDIVDSMLKYGTISDRQMKYAEKVLEIYKEEVK